MMVVVLATCLYTGWFMKTSKLVDEIEFGAEGFKSNKIMGVVPARLWVFTIRYICPVIIVLVVLSVLGIIG
jgi:NSS family neurotransmitter:Na+ symporter